MDKKPSVYNLTLAGMEAWAATRDEPSYRAKQVLHWLYQKRISRFQEMSDLSERLRNELDQAFLLQPLSCARKIVRDLLSFSGHCRHSSWVSASMALARNVKVTTEPWPLTPLAPGGRVAVICSVAISRLVFKGSRANLPDTQTAFRS